VAERFPPARRQRRWVRRSSSGEGDPVDLAAVRAGGASPAARTGAGSAGNDRFETPPGKQLQIDFGERRVAIAMRM